MIFAWIKARREEQIEGEALWPVSVMCRVLHVSRAGYYAWLKRKPCKRQEQQMNWIEQIKAAHQQSHRTYGSPRITVELNQQGVQICENTVAKLMRREGVAARIKRRFLPQTTDSSHDCPIAPNRLEQNFNADVPNVRWTSDITYIPTDQGWMYLAVVMDLFSRKIVGWSMQPHMKAELACDALRSALDMRQPKAGRLLHHSDRGVQYACAAYQQLLREAQIEPSMSRTANCYDNAVTESFFGTLKTELVNHQHYATHEQARQSVFEWIHVFYNRQRRHSSLEYLSPEAFEAKLN